MHTLIREVQKEQLKRVPEIRTGYTVRVSQKIREGGGKERVQQFEGLVIKVGHGEGAEKTITVRKIVQGIGVEKIFPLHSTNITKIEVKKKAKVRRAKLYYMRQRSGKSARLQERQVTEDERVAEEAKMEAMIQEAVKADEEQKAQEAKHAPDSDSGAEGAEGDAESSSDEQSSAEALDVSSAEAPETAEVEATTTDGSEAAPAEEPKEEPANEPASDEPKKEEAEEENPKS